jgi:imidazole glycerol-phosphate synthase subunit HisF
MLRPRIIPCLLVKDGGLVKTVRFGSPKYVGDPINAVRIFNEKEVDELVVLDIDASARGREPDYVMIRNLAAECRMPLCYGGGVKTLEQAERIIGMGVEKVSLSSAAIEDPGLVARMADVVGGQSVVVVLDVRRNKRGAAEVWTHNGTRSAGKLAVDLAKTMADRGAGEIVVNSIDNDGVMKGYDLDLVAAVRGAVGVPVTVLGGAGSLEHVAELIRRFGLVGAAAGSLFVFKGVYRAVLINYPSRADKDALLARASAAR